MRTTRIKSIIIVILALVNIFLLALLFAQQHQAQEARRRSVAQLSTLLSSNGISFDPALLPKSTPLPAAQPSRSTDAELAFAQKLLGTVSGDEVGGGIYTYENDVGSLQFRTSGALSATLQRDIASPVSFCRDLCRSYGYRMDDTAVLSENGSGTLRAVRTVDGLSVFNAALSFAFEQNRLTAVDGTFLPDVSTSEGSKGIDAISALVDFLDYRNANGIICTEITQLEAGYLLQESAASSARLLPVWHITTNISNYYVNQATGELLRD